MPNRVPRENGTGAQLAAARKYGLDLKSGSSGFWDARHRSNGRKVQVKRAIYEREGGQPGRFRFWRSHLRDLAAAQGSVVLVVENPSNDHRPILKVTRESPHVLLDVLAGSWRESNQADMDGMTEGRVSWREVVEL